MRLVWAALGACGVLAASGACSDSSSSDSAAGKAGNAAAGTVGVGAASGVAGANAASGGAPDSVGGSNGGARDSVGGSSSGAPDSVGGSSGGVSGDGGSSAGEAGGGLAGSGGAGAGGGPCTTGPIECEPGTLFAASGTFTTAGSSDLIALDDTTLLVGNHVDQALNVFDLCTGAVKKSWELPAQPDDIAYDVSSRTAYVVLRDQAAIAKVELDGAGVELIDLPTTVVVLTTGNDGRVFALLDTPPFPALGVSIIDGPGAAVLDTVGGFSGSLLAYDHESDKLLAGGDGGLEAFSFVEATNELVFDDRNWNTGGGNCRQLIISPNQSHVVLTCGGGNTVTQETGPYQILDVDPANLQVFYGLFNVGYYPQAAAFSPGGRYFFATGEDGVLVFDGTTHARIGSYSMGADQLTASPSGRVLLSRQGMANVSVLSWAQLNEPNDCGGGAGGAGGAGGTGGIPDLGESATVCTTGPILCESGSPLPASGQWPIPRTYTVVALSDTTVLFGNQLNNRLDVLDLCTGMTRWSWQLPSAPGVSALDRAQRLLYVTLAGTTSIAKVSLDSAGVELIDVPAPAISLALGADDVVFARLDDGFGLDAPISIVDAAQGTVLATRRGQFDEIIAFHLATDRLLSGSSDGGVKAFEFTAQTRELAEAESSASMSYPCFELALSPDQNHLFFACSNGTTPTPPAQGADFDPTDLTSPFGIYENGLSTVAAAYSPGGARLFVTTSSGVAEHDVVTRLLIDTHDMPLPIRLTVAPSGRVLMGGGVLHLNNDDISLSWKVLDTPDCQP
jgi:hypothetical protein